MQFHIHSDASYLSSSKAIIRVWGHFFLSEKFNPTSQTKHNGEILVVVAILKNVMASASEAELGGMFINAKEWEVLRTSLKEMVHPQGSTLMQTNNSTACGIINETVKQCIQSHIHAFYWVRNRCKQKNFLIYWSPGKYNMGDYHTKFHSPLAQKKYYHSMCTQIHHSNTYLAIPVHSRKGVLNNFPPWIELIRFGGESMIIRSVRIYCRVKYWQRTYRF